MDNKQLCQWLRDNSSGVYRPAAYAAEVIENLMHEIERTRIYNAQVEATATKHNAENVQLRELLHEISNLHDSSRIHRILREQCCALLLPNVQVQR